MELVHGFSVPASFEETWDAFNDINSVAGCFPGAMLTSMDGEEFHGTIKIKFGPVSMQYAGTASFDEREYDEGRLRIRATGKDRRGQGTAEAVVTAVLAETAGHTHVNVHTELAITGKPAQFGGGMIEDVSERLLSQFVSALSEQMSSNEHGDPSSGGSSPTNSVDQNGPASTTEGSSATRVGSTPRESDSKELNFLSMVLSGLVRRYAGHSIAAVVFLLLGWLLGHFTRGSRRAHC